MRGGRLARNLHARDNKKDRNQLYTILKYEDKKEIAEIYGLAIDDLLTYFPILANCRNLCAHEDILYDHKMQRSIDDTPFHFALNIPKMDGEYIYGKL